MKRFALVALLAVMTFGLVSSASATELKVKGSFEVMGEWSANVRDWDSDISDGDNQYLTQRLRTYFTFQTNENLMAVLGLEMDNTWGAGDTDWGTDVSQTSKNSEGAGAIEIKHAYLDFNFPDTAINTKVGLQAVALPGVFGSPIFNDDAPAILVSAPINDMFGVTVGFTRGRDASTPYGGTTNKDEVDAAMLIMPVTLDGFAVTPYFAYAWMGANAGSPGGSKNSDAKKLGMIGEDATVWVLGANAKLTMLDPLTFAADLIYGELDVDNSDIESKGWYAALAASYKFDFMTGTLFGTYATGYDDDTSHNKLPSLAEGWALTPNLGGTRAFGMAEDSAVESVGGVTGDGTGLWSIGVKLDKISFVDKLSHSLTIAYAEGTSDKDAGKGFDEKDSAWEVYLVNQYMIYENLAAINELGYFAPDFDESGREDDASYFATIGLSYKF
jgi:hypothetical protein